MKKVLVVGVGLIILTLLGSFIVGQISGQGNRNGTPVVGALKDYASATLGIEIGYPKTWSVQEDGKGVYFISPKTDSADTIRENINVLVEDLAEKVDLAEYTTSALFQVAALDNYSMQDDTKSRVGVLPGHMITYQAMIEGHTMQFQQAWTVKDDKAYLITLAAAPETFSNYRAIFNRMAKSFKVQTR
ncbi:MAG: PsbP-related protein [Patescibacteria group bacterium]